MTLLIQVACSHFRAGLVATEGRVTRTAPILAWALGKTPQDVAAWALKKGGSVAVVRRIP